MQCATNISLDYEKANVYIATLFRNAYAFDSFAKM